MITRRLTTLLVGFLMLHLTIVGADIACAQPAGRAMVGHQHADGHPGSMRDAPRADASTPDQPCQTPAQPECCRTMTTCAVNAAFAAQTRLSEPPTAHAVIRPTSTRAPRSQVTSPDPPPPKA